jgi:excisionase family DNA binding protein
MDVIFDIRGAAEYLHIKKWTLYRLAKKGKVPGIKVGGQWRFKKDVLDNMFYGGSQKAKKRQEPTDD